MQYLDSNLRSGKKEQGSNGDDEERELDTIERAMPEFLKELVMIKSVIRNSTNDY